MVLAEPSHDFPRFLLSSHLHGPAWWHVTRKTGNSMAKSVICWKYRYLLKYDKASAVEPMYAVLPSANSKILKIKSGWNPMSVNLNTTLYYTMSYHSWWRSLLYKVWSYSFSKCNLLEMQNQNTNFVLLSTFAFPWLEDGAHFCYCAHVLHQVPCMVYTLRMPLGLTLTQSTTLTSMCRNWLKWK